MKNIITLLLMACLFAGCITAKMPNEHKAQKKLRKALKWDPNIVSMQRTDTTIEGVVNLDTTFKIVVPGFEGNTKGFDCDDIKNQLDQLKGDIGAGLYIHRDSNIDISVKKDADGKMSVQYVVKPQIITKYVNVPVPYKVKVSVPGKVFKQNIKAPLTTYPGFWGLLLLSCLMTYLYISNQVRQVNLNKGRNDKGTS